MSRSGGVLYLKGEKMPAVCKMNSIPFDETGERIEREGMWRVYEFWERFEGFLGNNVELPNGASWLLDSITRHVNNADVAMDELRG
jgi:hypothetical protein